MRNIGFFLSLCRGKAEDPAARRWKFRNREEKIRVFFSYGGSAWFRSFSAEIMRENKKRKPEPAWNRWVFRIRRISANEF
jgi:hypothetical protein